MTDSTARVDVVALGEAMVEFNQAHVDDPYTWLQGFGGDTSNMAIAAARLGARSGYVTRVGNDAFGRRLVELWKREYVATEGVAIDDDAPTGVYFVSHGDGHEFSYLRAGGARVSYDTNLRLKLWPLKRARAIVFETLRAVDWALPSLDDASRLFGSEDPARIVDACHALGAAVVVLKLGSARCLVPDGRRSERLPGGRVDAVDATGAGDCFDGAFIARVVAGDEVFAAAPFANAAAALATTGYGAVAPLPRRNDVDRLLGTHSR